MSENPKKRLPNFSNIEKLKLIQLVEREKSIIENKRTDTVTLKDKNICWLNITKEFNSTSTSEYRDITCLKNCWDNLKKKTRKYFAEIRTEVFKTGGGKMNIINDPIAERVKIIIQPSVEGLQNVFDSDNMSGKDNPQCSEQLDDLQCSKQLDNTQRSKQWDNTQRRKQLDNTQRSKQLDNSQCNKQLDNSQCNKQLDNAQCNKQLDNAHCSKQLEDEDCYDIEMLEEENSNITTWAEWTPDKLSSKKSKELSSYNNNNGNCSLLLEDVETALTQSGKENCNPTVTNSLSGPKRKKWKQLQISTTKRNKQFYDLAQSKLELVEILKETHYKKEARELLILETQLEKERLQVEILKKQLNEK